MSRAKAATVSKFNTLSHCAAPVALEQLNVNSTWTATSQFSFVFGVRNLCLHLNVITMQLNLSGDKYQHPAQDWLVRAELNFSLDFTRSFHPLFLRQMPTGELVKHEAMQAK